MLVDCEGQGNCPSLFVAKGSSKYLQADLGISSYCCRTRACGE